MKKQRLYTGTILFVMTVLSAWGARTIANRQEGYLQKIAPFVQKQMKNQRVVPYALEQVEIPVLVIMKEQADLSQIDTEHLSKEERGKLVFQGLTQVAEKTQVEILEYLKQKNLRFQAFYIRNMIAVWGADAALISEIAKRDDVSQVVGNPKIANQIPGSNYHLKSETAEPVENNLASVRAPEVWNEFKVRGEGIVVAGQDTGVEWTHPGLKKHYRGFSDGVAQHDYNWRDSIQVAQPGNSCGQAKEEPCDDNDHGSHTMGTMIGEDDAGNTVGVAPAAKWIACRNMDAGLGAPSSYIDCFQFFLAPYPVKGNAAKDGDPSKAPHVINNSWGCPTSEGCQGDVMLPILRAMEKAGVFVVVSAGNDGPSCSTIQDPPAMHSDDTFSVGAYDVVSDQIAYFSSRGPSKFDLKLGPDLVAPGVNVRSTIRGGEYAKYGWSGTSMAGPHVVGVVALMWSANPKLVGKIAETSEILRKTSKPKTSATENCGDVPGTSIPNNTYGYGLIDAYEAVKAAKQY